MQIATNNTRKNASSVEATPTCQTCGHFAGIVAFPKEEGPMAWCNPPKSKMSQPCMPYQNASNLSCYTPN